MGRARDGQQLVRTAVGVRRDMGARRWPWIAGAGVACFVLVFWWIGRPSRERVFSEGVLMRSSTTPADDAHMHAAMERCHRGDDVPAGYCFLRFPPASVLGWNGRRTYAFALVSNPADRVRVAVWRDDRPERRLDSPAPAELPIVIETPLFGLHDYRFEVQAADGGTMSYECKLAGTIAVDLERAW